MTPAEHLDAAIKGLIECGLIEGGADQKLTLHVRPDNTVRKLVVPPPTAPSPATIGRQAMHRNAA